MLSNCWRKEEVPLQVVPFASYPTPTNRISTTKYHPVLFLPATLVMQFTRLANLYFLATAIIQSIPSISPLEPFDAVLPLAFVLIASLIRESVQEWAKYRFDREVNAIESEVWQQGQWKRLKSEQLRVGMICRIHDEEILPADMIALKTAKPEGVLYLETSGLDGEKALKNRYVCRQHQQMPIEDYRRLSFKLSELSQSLYAFEAEWTINSSNPSLLGLKSFLFRGSRLKNSDHVVALVVYVGAHTKTMLNSCKPENKMSSLERRVNIYIVVIFVLEIILISVEAALVYFTAIQGPVLLKFNQDPLAQVPITFVSYFILLNTMIPISLIVSIEVIKSIQGYLISHDELMKANRGGDIISSRTFRSSLNEELGMVDYVFTDKTGTLTRNEMVMKELLIGKKAYLTTNKADEYQLQRVFQSEQIATQRLLAEPLEQPLLLSGLLSNSLNIRNQSELIEFFLFCVSMCHECVLNSKTVGQSVDKIEYEGSSPDEIALVDTARWLGWVYQGKTFNQRLVLNNGRQLSFEVLDLFEFDSDRKRMTIVLKYDEHHALLVMKGADNIVKQRLARQQYFLHDADRKVEENSTKGLRTLLLCFKFIELQKYQQFHDTVCNLTEKEKLLKSKLVGDMETNMILIGATAVEDRLQDKVPETIRDLLRANIKVCMLTGDKLETAENIARSCNLITPETHVMEVREQDPTNGLVRAYKQCGEHQKNNRKVSLVVEGTALASIVHCALFHKMLELCDSVVCCRVTPADKASVVKVARRYLHKRTLAIGDGANDVEMISHANLGIGLYGNEGMSAVQASDYALPEFKALWRLLFVHGRWNYMRIAEMVKYFFFKNMVFTVPQFCYSFYQAYSGASIYIGLYLSLFNTIFTALPVVVRAVLQQDVNYLHYVGEEDEVGEISQPSTRGTSLDHPILHPKVRVNDRVRSLLPCLYIIGQQNLFFTHSSFILVNIEAFFFAILIYFTIYFAEPDADYMTFTLSVYTSVVFLVTAKLCFQVQYWTWLLVICIFITSLVPYIAFNYLTSLIETSSTYASFEQVFSSPIFYLVVLLTSGITMVLTAVIDMIKRYFMPTRIDRARKQMVRYHEALKKRQSLSDSQSSRYHKPLQIQMAELAT